MLQEGDLVLFVSSSQSRPDLPIAGRSRATVRQSMTTTATAKTIAGRWSVTVRG